VFVIRVVLSFLGSIHAKNFTRRGEKPRVVRRTPFAAFASNDFSRIIQK
jgi:hypothetical protein